MKTKNQYEPSSKVAVTLILVVLLVSGVILMSKMQTPKQNTDMMQDVELLVERRTDENFKSGDKDQDGLTDWLEEFYKTDPNNPDTDGDGTMDGEEIKLGRHPAIAGPDDPYVTRKDMITTEANFREFVAGTLTDKVSVDLFSKYISLKKEGSFEETKGEEIATEISKNVTEQVSLKDKYNEGQLYIVESSRETVEIYGDRLAQETISFLSRADQFKSLKEDAYMIQLAKEYKDFADILAKIRVPDVVKQPHLLLVNYIYNRGVFFDSLVHSGSDPVTSFVILNQFKSITYDDQALYTILGQYFKNNGIIFDVQSTINFWKQFQN